MPIRLFHTDSKAVHANHIVPYGLKSRTSQSDSSIRTQKSYKPIRSFHTDYKAVQANQIAPFCSDGHRPEFQKISSHSHDPRSHEWQNQKKFQKGSSHRTIPDRTSDGPRSPSVKPPSHRTISDRTKITVETWRRSCLSAKVVLSCTQ